MKKVIKIVIIFLIVISFLNAVVYGFTVNDIQGKLPNNTVKQPIYNVGNTVVTILSTIGSIVSVVVLVALGIKDMMGSVEEKAEYKKTLLPYVVGAMIVFAASTIAGVVFNLSQQIPSSL